MENQVVNNVFVNKVVYKLYLWKNIMKMVINLLMCYYKRLHYSCYPHSTRGSSTCNLQLQYFVYSYS